jgi:hypothetical protein
MPVRFFCVLVALLMVLCTPARVNAQGFDPRPVLHSLISAFQNCGPPQSYQVLSPLLFQLIAAQTNGQGCYPQIRAAGPVQNMQVIDQREFPIGPVYVVRVFHPNFAADWFIGFNRFTSRVEYMSFQAANGPAPTVAAGPTAPIGGQPPVGVSVGQPSAGGQQPSRGGAGDGCALYPAMCQ